MAAAQQQLVRENAVAALVLTAPFNTDESPLREKAVGPVAALGREADAQAQIQASAIGLTAPFDTNDEPYVIGIDD